MGIVLDSGTFIMAERKGWSIRQLLAELEQRFGPVPFCTSVVTLAELAHGTYRATAPHRERQTNFLNQVIDQLRVESFTAALALELAKVGATLADAGLRLDFQDLVIGVTARSLNYAVLTNNPRHFNRIPGLLVHPL